MNNQFIPYEQALELKKLGFNEKCAAHFLAEDEIELKWEMHRNLSINTTNLIQAPTFSQAFSFFRTQYNFTYSIGNTNIAIIHYELTTQLLQNNESYEAAELAAIKWFIDVAKQL